MREELVTVLSTSDPTLVTLVKSFLDGEGIAYIVKGEGTRGLIAPSVLWGSSAVTMVKIQVHVKDAEVVKAFLKGVSEIEDE